MPTINKSLTFFKDLKIETFISPKGEYVALVVVDKATKTAID
jgi:hypothetical protein